MVVLKKIKSATLVEVIVATVLIVIIFIIASLILNNILLNTFSKNTHAIETRLNEIEYEIQTDQIKIPYQEKYKDWEVAIKIKKSNTKMKLIMVATNKTNNKEISRQQNYVEN
jgi:lipopolysaccharide export LptBFGC system permease protein LptF